MKERSNVALTRCYFCGEADKILLCTKYRPDGRGGMVPAKDMSEFDGKVIDREPCPTCQGYMKQGVILISVSDDSAEGLEPCRTGGFWVVTDDGIRRSMPADVAEEAIKRRVAFVPNCVCRKMGLPDCDKLVTFN